MLKEIKGTENILRAHLNGLPIYTIISDDATGKVFIKKLEICAAENCRYLVDEPEQEAKSEDATPPPMEKSKRRSRVDTGKIRALHNAGWNNAKIADEMDISPITVSKYVKMIKEEQDGSRSIKGTD